MKRRRASLIINPRAGQNLAQIADILAVLAAAGWKTDLALKEYGGQTLALATEAAGKGSDLVVAYGGDGTLNQVVNGVMHARNQRSAVGLIPGGTANVWANEIGVPMPPVDAALALIDSEPRQVDIGHISVDGLHFTDGTQCERDKLSKKERRKLAQARQHFLLMAGLGIDAAVMRHVSKPLKQQLGALAVGVSSLKELPEQHPFPVEIGTGDAQHTDILWKGEALQVVIGNTRLYADIVQMTPDAHIDDGVLDVCVITAGNPLTTMQQLVSLLLRHKPDNLTAEYFRGAHLSIRVPASVALQLDGSAVKLKEYLSKSEQRELARADKQEQALVTYHIDVMPQALTMAIPRTYHGALFEATADEAPPQQEAVEPAPTRGGSGEAAKQSQDFKQSNAQSSESGQQEEREPPKEVVAQGREVTVRGVRPDPAGKQTYILAGSIKKQSTGEEKPVGVRIDACTVIQKKTGAHLTTEELAGLRAGDVILVDGKKDRRGAIAARRIVI